MEVVNYAEQGKTISINDLPDFTTKEFYQSIVMDQSAKICVIAIQRGEYWAAYIGHPAYNELTDEAKSYSLANWKSQHCYERQGVINFGDMLAENIARLLFPDWSNKPYQTQA